VPIELDPRFTFDALVVGTANRLAVAAARRVAEAPGSTYNPLFIYSASGLGKTHLLTAVGHQVQRLHGIEVTYETVEHLMDQISRALQAGERDAFRSPLGDSGLILLDDVQFLTGRRQVQDELIRSWDEHIGRGGQVVLTSDRPPQDIDALDDRLVSRLSGGLIVDMSAPDYETRIAIARRKADERGHTFEPAVYQVLARIAFTNVRELQGSLNRLIAVQELEGRTVTADEVSRLLGKAADRGVDEFGEFLSDISGTMGSVVDEADRAIADAILAWEGEGFRTRRLDRALDGTRSVDQANDLIRRFEEDASRLRAIENEIRQLDGHAPELAASPLRDPDRIAEAEALLVAVREGQTPPPAPPAGGGLDTLPGDSLAVRAARAVAAAPGATYNPLYVLGPANSGKTTVLAALGNEVAAKRGAVVAYVRGDTFEAELIEALSAGRVEAWRARYRRADMLLLDGLDALAHAEGAHDEIFHLFEDLHRKGAQLVFAAEAPPQELPVPARLRSRLESGLVVELETDMAGEPRPTAPGSPGAGASAEVPGGRRLAHWIRNPEKVLWEWPYVEDWIEESPD
jgi:chromosomal replication initiator protein